MMKQNKYLTNQELLSELKERLPNFNQDEFQLLLNLIHPHQERVFKIIQETDPQVYHAIRKQQEQWEKEENDKNLENLKNPLNNYAQIQKITKENIKQIRQITGIIR